MPSGAALFGDRLGLAEEYASLLAGPGVERGLIGPREVPRIWDRHVLNCAVLSPAVPAESSLADVGSGAGLPGLVLAIARPDLSVTLVEPLLRRTVFLELAVAELGLTNVSVLRSRASEVGTRFDVVTARAVAALPKLAGWCLPLVRLNGLFLAMKGESVDAEVAEAAESLTSLGAQSWTVEEYGEGLVDPPARVVRVVAGIAVRSSGAGSGSSRSGSRSSGSGSSGSGSGRAASRRKPGRSGGPGSRRR